MIRQRLPALACFLTIIMIIQTGCGEITQIPTFTAQPAVIETGEPIQEIPEATQLPPVEQAGETPAVVEAPTEPPDIETPIQEQQPSLVAPVDKPSLLISTFDETESLLPSRVFTSHTIGFIFPDGLVATKAAAVNNPSIIEDNLTAVGVIEIGPEAEKIEPGVYVVAIDLESNESQVAGRVITGDNSRDLMFKRTALVRNPDRPDSSTFPAISPIISSHAVCFVVALFEPQGKATQAENISWVRYCSDDPILSVRDNFPAQYEALISILQSKWEESLQLLEERNLPIPEIDFDLTISEMEGHSNITACNETNECAADISGAPSASFWTDYDIALDYAQKQEEEEGEVIENFAVTAGFVRVERELDIPGQEIVLPGDYLVRIWFDSEGIFLGTTLLGVTDDNVLVPGQTIPATPAYFLDADDDRTIVSWVSAWRLCKWCAFQSKCP